MQREAAKIKLFEYDLLVDLFGGVVGLANDYAQRCQVQHHLVDGC
jgi:hypothetical protein